MRTPPLPSIGREDPGADSSRLTAAQGFLTASYRLRRSKQSISVNPAALGGPPAGALPTMMDPFFRAGPTNRNTDRAELAPSLELLNAKLIESLLPGNSIRGWSGSGTTWLIATLPTLRRGRRPIVFLPRRRRKDRGESLICRTPIDSCQVCRTVRSQRLSRAGHVRQSFAAGPSMTCGSKFHRRERPTTEACLRLRVRSGSPVCGTRERDP